MKKPIRNEKGYVCPICQKFFHEYAIQVYRHMSLVHGEKSKKSKQKKAQKKHDYNSVSYDNVSRETVFEESCCNSPHWTFLDERKPLERRALGAGFQEVCQNCGELRT